MKSKLHKETLKVVKECYPNEAIVEELPIKAKGHTLFIDIFIPRLKIGIECDGVQHFEFSKMYHGDQYALARQKSNDRIKESFCEDKGITLIRIKYNDKITREFIYEKILSALTESDDV